MHYHIQMRKKVLKHTQEAEWKQSGNKMYATNIENKEDSHQKKKKLRAKLSYIYDDKFYMYTSRLLPN